MLEKMSKFLFSFSALLSISCFNWIEMWILMEINMIAFSIFMTKKSKFEISMKYFSIQMISSTMILTSMIMKEKENFKSKIFLMAIFLKTGLFPFFSWVMKISEKISWMKVFFLSTIQKIISMSMILKFKSVSMEMFILMNMIITSLMLNFWKSSKKVLLVSSISNFSWMLLMNMSSTMMISFFSIYSLTLYFLLEKMEKEGNKNMNFSKKKISKIMEIITISGMPPFIMFFMKWKISEDMMINNSILMVMMIFFLSSIMTVFYFKTSLKQMFKEKSKMISENKLNFLNMIFFWKMTN